MTRLSRESESESERERERERERESESERERREWNHKPNIMTDGLHERSGNPVIVNYTA